MYHIATGMGSTPAALSARALVRDSRRDPGWMEVDR
jgi:hypothetical protein